MKNKVELTNFDKWWKTRQRYYKVKTRPIIRRASLAAWCSGWQEGATNKKVKIQWSDNHDTAQIYGGGIELALCSDDNRQIGTFVLCKDFFQDAISAYIHDEECDVYDYEYDPKTFPRSLFSSKMFQTGLSSKSNPDFLSTKSLIFHAKQMDGGLVSAAGYCQFLKYGFALQEPKLTIPE
jgi:hypothetical protein